MRLTKKYIISVRPTGIALLVVCAVLGSFFVQTTAFSKTKESSTADYEDYVDFFMEVFKTMDKNYYLPVRRKDFNRFVVKFKRNIYSRLKDQKKSVDYIRWRSAAYLVDHLKDPNDTFSAFMPPKPAKKFEKKVLGKKVDLGIEGELVDLGYRVVFIEPRCDAYLKGIREDDVIIKIDDNDVKKLTEGKIKELLNPDIDTVTKLTYFDDSEQKISFIEAISKEYFKQTVFSIPVEVPGIYCLDIRSFNRKTSEDMHRYLSTIENQKNAGLILDLRNNPGGLLSFQVPGQGVERQTFKI